MPKFARRGTKSVHDILTDVGMETQPFMGAYGHASMVRSVKVHIFFAKQSISRLAVVLWRQ